MDHEHQSAQNENTDNSGNINESITAAQFAAIEAAAARDGVTFETEPFTVAPTYIWQKDHILVSPGIDERTHPVLQRLQAELARNVDGSEQMTAPDLPKLLVLRNPDDRTTRQIVADLNNMDDLKDRISRNNLLYVTHGDGANLCPATEPIPVRPYPETIPYPPPSGGDAGLGVHVKVIDTGLSPDWEVDHPWLYNADCHPTEVSGDPESDTFKPNREIDQHAGHGEFIAGLIRCVAPRATVNVANTMRWAGAMHDFEVARAIIEVLDECEPDIISLSAGCLIKTDENTMAPQAMLAVINRLRQPGCKTLLVAAAGNDGKGPDSDQLFYPAAFAGQHGFDEVVVAVGALREERDGRACFSNYGDWVTVYEDGENLVNAFPIGRYIYHEPFGGTVQPHCAYYHEHLLEEGCSCVTAPARGTIARFRGMAKWSGTSFSTPIVVGRVVRHMTENPRFTGNPRAALQDLLKQRTTISDAGDSFPLSVFPLPVSR